MMDLIYSVFLMFGKGEYTTNSEVKDNIHWLNGIDNESILFRFNITGLKSTIPDLSSIAGRLYVDPSQIENKEEFAPFISQEKAKNL